MSNLKLLLCKYLGHKYKDKDEQFNHDNDVPSTPTECVRCGHESSRIGRPNLAVNIEILKVFKKMDKAKKRRSS